MSSNIPDFVLQIQEVERNLKAEWQVVRQDWRDQASENYDRYVMQPYTDNFSRYITGDGLTGYGVDQLMQQMGKHLEDMEAVSGVSQNVQFCYAAAGQHNGKLRNMFRQEIDVEGHRFVEGRDGVVHDENRDRDYWDKDRDGAKPGELRDNDILEIYKEKQYGI